MFYFFFKLFTSCDLCSSNYPGKKTVSIFFAWFALFFSWKKMMLVVFNLSKYNNGHRHRLFSFYYSENVTSFLIVCMGGTRIPKFLNCQQMNVFFFMVFIISWKSKFFLKKRVMLVVFSLEWKIFLKKKTVSSFYFI